MYHQHLLLVNIPTEVLVIIFGFLPKPDLLNMMVVCKRFYGIIQYFWDCIIFNRREKFLVTNQLSEYIENRSVRILTPYGKNRISNNWKRGRYKAINLYLSDKFIPQFHLEKQSIWFGKGDFIRCYRRAVNKIYIHNIKYQLRGFNCKDVCKFVVKNKNVSTANGNMVKLFSVEEEECTSSVCFKDLNLTSIDMESNLVAVGSKEGKVKLLTISEMFNLVPSKTLECKDRIWCLALANSKLALGSATNSINTCIIVTDPESGQTLREFNGIKRGAGVLHLKWDGPDMLWSGGYDFHLRRWDLRSGECVQKFLDPWCSKINCFDYDYVNTVITGCDANRATLWDTRRVRYVQQYYMGCSTPTWIRSPIHCLSFDAEHLFAATDCYMNMLNFTVRRGEIQDYSSLYLKQLVI